MQLEDARAAQTAVLGWLKPTVYQAGVGIGVSRLSIAGPTGYHVAVLVQQGDVAELTQALEDSFPDVKFDVSYVGTVSAQLEAE